MEKERKDRSFIKKPIYEGGKAALKQFIHQNLKYPKEALEQKIEGKISIRFEIDHKGKTGKSKIIAGLGHGCDEEASRLISLLKFTVPKNPRKLKISFHKTMHIHFKLPKSKSLNYSITTNSPTTKKSGGSYHYSIEL